MAVVSLRPPLRDLAGGTSDVELNGSSLLEVLRSLENAHPRTVGWVLDEHGRIRRHVNVFVNGEMTREDLPLGPGDRVHVVPSITGGC
ncbi:MAG: MoaD/ThiS family protein [Actinomycetota bacterium]